MIMKLHTLTPHEFVGVGGGPVLLQQYFQYAFICCPYMLPLLLISAISIDPQNSAKIRQPQKIPVIQYFYCANQ